MRKHLVSVTFAGLLSMALVPAAHATTKVEGETVAQTPVAVQRVAVPARGISDSAAMVLVGTALIGLAAAVRRAA